MMAMQMRARQESSPRRAYTVVTTPNGSVHHRHGKLDAAAQPQSNRAAVSNADAAGSALAARNRGPPEGASTSTSSPDETLQVPILE